MDYQYISATENTVQTRAYTVKSAFYIMDVTFKLRHFLTEIETGNAVTWESPDVQVKISLPPEYLNQ